MESERARSRAQNLDEVWKWTVGVGILVFALASMLAGISGVLAGPIVSVYPQMGLVFTVKGLAVAAVGGFTNPLAKFASDSTVLRSGFLRGSEYIRGFAAAVDVKHERGHAVLLAFQNRLRAWTARHRNTDEPRRTCPSTCSGAARRRPSTPPRRHGSWPSAR